MSDLRGLRAGCGPGRVAWCGLNGTWLAQPAGATDAPAARLLHRGDWRLPAPVMDMKHRRWGEDVMRRLRVLVFAAGAAALPGTGCARAAPATTAPMPGTTRVSTPAAAVRPAGLWGRAIAVPGLAALNKGRNAGVSSVSCASLGSCAAVGGYTDGGGHRQGFVAVEENSVWGRAAEVPGLGFLNEGGHAGVSSVSCGSAGSCAAVGDYTDGSGHQQGFVAVEENSVWGRAAEVPGLGALNQGGAAYVSSVSCASPGSCAAGGDYRAGAVGNWYAFVVSEQNGSWGTARQVAGNLSTGPGGDAGVDTVSCGSPGNCAAGGQYGNASGDQAFVISEVNGTWAAAQAVAGTRSSTGGAQVTSVSCASAGNCAAGGQFDYGGYNAAFLVNEKNGAWGKLIYVPGLNAVSRDAYLNSVSCASPGNCAAGGDYDLGVFVAIEKNGVWGKETTVPGALPVEAVHSVSCASAGSCVAGGSYAGTGRGYVLQGFVT